MALLFLVLLALLSASAYWVSRSRAHRVVGGRIAALHSLPAYHGLLAASLALLAMILVFAIGMPLASWTADRMALSALDPAVLSDPLAKGAVLRDVRNLAAGNYSGDPSDGLRAAAATYQAWQSRLSMAALFGGLIAGVGAALLAWRQVGVEFRARNRFETVVRALLFACSAVAVLTTVGILASVLFESLRFFQKVPVSEFLFGLQWSPQTAIRADQVGSSGAFGIVPLVGGTMLITLVALIIAGPVGLFAAVYLAEYASPRFRNWAKPILEILAGIPTVVLGFFAALTVAPFLRETGARLGLEIASESALAAGLVMGMMIIPFISSLSDDVINSVPQSLRDGSYALGATRSETIRKVVLPAALPGIVSAFMLAISRAIGETMIVVMAAGLAANLTFNPLQAVTTFTVQIKTILVGDQEFDSAKTLAAFALGLVLFFITLALNYIALQIVKRYREQYV